MRHQYEYRQIEHNELSWRSTSDSKKVSPITELGCQGFGAMESGLERIFFL